MQQLKVTDFPHKETYIRNRFHKKIILLDHNTEQYTVQYTLQYTVLYIP